MRLDIPFEIDAVDPHASPHHDVRDVHLAHLAPDRHVRHAEIVGDFVDRHVLGVHHESPRIDLMRYRVSKLRPPIFPLTKSEAQLLDLPTEDAIFD